MKKALKYFLILLIFGLLWYGQFWLRRYSAPPLFGESVLQVETSEKVVALTYDDGPNVPYTDDLLEILAQHKAKATFFVVGKEVDKYPETFKHIVTSGHDIGNHSWNHKRLTYKSPSFITEQIASTDLNPGTWSIPDASFLIKLGIWKGVWDEEEVHGGSDRL